MNDMESLARKCFREQAPDAGVPAGCLSLFGVTFVVSLIANLADYAGLMSMDADNPGPVGGLIIIAWLIASVYFPRKTYKNRVARYVQKQLRAYRDGDVVAVQQVHNFAMQHFRALIEQHRARTLGPESEWARARAPLAEALDEADRSVAYWRERLKNDPGNEAGTRQYEVVKGLQDKFRDALAKVDKRAELLAQFYNECDAKLAVMDQCNQDIEEARKVEELSSKADVVIAQAEGAIHALAQSFVEEAQRIARALGETSGAQYKMLAGETSLDNIDYVADKIAECSASEQNMIKGMQRALAE